jgi:flagellar biosynthetic protein FlhB
MANSERTEKATATRRRKAREQGQFAYSQEVTGVLTLGACLGTAAISFSDASGFRGFFESVLASGPILDRSGEVTVVLRTAGIYALTAAAPVLAAALIAALAGNLLQGLPIYASEVIGLNWDRLNPAASLSRLKTRFSPFEWLKILLLTTAAALVFWTTLRGYWPNLIIAPAMPLAASTDLLVAMLRRIVLFLGVALVALAVGDFYLQRWRFEESIKMTKAEVKEDMKSSEGNPAVKGKVRSIQRERARRRMMERVKTADVVVTNPTHYAVALEYKAGAMGAPRVVAKGRGWIAQRIKALAREHEVPLVENVPLARALYRSVALDQEIPAELYRAVAEVLAFVFRARNKK